jgi:sensor c-di-GMP phosphodiesterase-like protein
MPPSSKVVVVEGCAKTLSTQMLRRKAVHRTLQYWYQAAAVDSAKFINYFDSRKTALLTVADQFHLIVPL